MRGKLIYKCRLCGELHKPTGVPDIFEAIINVLIGSPLPEKWGSGKDIQVLEFHNCRDGRLGVSDIVGAEGDVSV